MNGDDFSILKLIATVVVTIGVPAMVGLLWNMSNRLTVLSLDHVALEKRVKVAEKKIGIDVLALVVCVGVLTASAPGCASHTDRIRDGAASVRTDASAARADLSAAIGTGDVGERAAPFIRSADTRLGSIEAAADGITIHVQSVRDTGGGILSSIVRAIVWGLVIAAAALAVGALLYAYLPILVAKVALWFPRFVVAIPRRIRDAAKMLMEARDEAPSPKLDAFIAAHRAASPTFDAMVRTIKKNEARSAPAGA